MMLMRYLFIMIMILISFVPIAQSLWGTYVFSYKNPQHALNAVLMIMFAKGDFSELTKYTLVLPVIFLVAYYMMILFLMHAAFHKI